MDSLRQGFGNEVRHLEPHGTPSLPGVRSEAPQRSGDCPFRRFVTMYIHTMPDTAYTVHRSRQSIGSTDLRVECWLQCRCRSWGIFNSIYVDLSLLFRDEPRKESRGIGGTLVRPKVWTFDGKERARYKRRMRNGSPIRQSIHRPLADKIGK